MYILAILNQSESRNNLVSGGAIDPVNAVALYNLPDQEDIQMYSWIQLYFRPSIPWLVHRQVPLV